MTAELMHPHRDQIQDRGLEQRQRSGMGRNVATTKRCDVARHHLKRSTLVAHYFSSRMEDAHVLPSMCNKYCIARAEACRLGYVVSPRAIQVDHAQFRARKQ